MWDQPSNPGWRALVRRVGRLLHSWWHGDRIRLAPAEGRLLALKPPCWLLVGDQPVEIVNVRVRHRAGKPSMIYSCQTRTGLGTLVVAPPSAGQALTVDWHEGNTVLSLRDTDVEVFQPGQG